MIQFVPAYLDPSTGSIAYQVAISGLLAAAATWRLYWHRIRRLFLRAGGASEEGGSTDSAQKNLARR
jgi:hypothetical protein